MSHVSTLQFVVNQLSVLLKNRFVPVAKKLIRVYETLPMQSNKYTQFVKIADFEGAQPSGYVLRWPFSVEGRGNAHILASPAMNPTELDDAYEVVIGAWGNHHIIIRKRINGAVLADVHVPHVLSETKLKTFVLDISEGKPCSIL